MALGLKKNGVDWDDILEPRGSSTARANVGIRKAGVDIAQRYFASTGGDTIGYELGVKKSGVDIGQLFRRLGYTPPSPPTASISGPTSVIAGVFIDDAWILSATNGGNMIGLNQVRFVIEGHSAGGWTSVGGAYTYSSGQDWTNMGSPDIFNTPGTYHFYFEVERNDGATAIDHHYVTVS
jgi:hypothetical protein